MGDARAGTRVRAGLCGVFARPRTMDDPRLTDDILPSFSSLLSPSLCRKDAGAPTS